MLYWCQFHYLLISHGQTTQILQKNRSPHTRNLSTFNRNCNLTLLITWNGIRNAAQTIPNTHTHTHLTALFPGLLGWAGTRKVKPIRILLKQETVSGSGISWAICKFAPRSRQITMPAPHHSVFYRPHALPAAQPTVSKHWRCIPNNLLKYLHANDISHFELSVFLTALAYSLDIPLGMFA